MNRRTALQVAIGIAAGGAGIALYLARPPPRPAPAAGAPVPKLEAPPAALSSKPMMAEGARARELAALFVSIERPETALIPQAIPVSLASVANVRPIVDCLRDPAKPTAQFYELWALYRFPWAAGLEAYLTLGPGKYGGPVVVELRIYDSGGIEPVAQAELHDESSDCGAGEAFDTLLIDLDGDGALDLAVRQHKWDSHGCEDWDGGNEDETTFAVKLWKGREFVLSDSFPKEKIESLFKSAGHAMLPDLPRDQHTLQCGTAAQKSRQPTVPVAPNSDRRAAGDDVELPEATVFHLMLRSSEHAGSLLNWYAPEMEKRGAKRVGDMYVDDNLVHSGGFGRDGTAAPKDPTKPGIWMQVFESDRETLVDIWESVPKAR